jgi:ATP-dependent helicase/nuclease subunit B
MQAAAQVIAAVNEARCQTVWQPVALIALDRSVVRRVRALLDGLSLQIADETGWRLSTTRAAAVLSRTLLAAHPMAATDELLDWLKSAWLRPDHGEASPTMGPDLTQAIGELEYWCRRHGMLGAWTLLPDEPGEAPAANPQCVPPGRHGMPESALRLWRWAREALSPLQMMWRAARPPLRDWLVALQQSLRLSGSLVALLEDEAGQLAWQTLRLDLEAEVDAEGETAWRGLSSQTRLDGTAFQRWVASVLENTTFRPGAPSATPDVVITPMARAVLRSFHAIVIPGADERQLGALSASDGWLTPRLCEALGLATPQSVRAAQWDAFQLLMTRPGVICLHRRTEGGAPVEVSAWIEKWAQQEDTVIGIAQDGLSSRSLSTSQVHMPAPALSSHLTALPTQLTATAYDTLRQCPYRFFATTVLALREQDELEEGLDRSDYGTWLHEVLRRFHQQRRKQLVLSTPDQDVAQWLQVAREVVAEMGLDRDGQRPFFLPYEADVPKMASVYVAWLRAHEAQGWCVSDMEAEAALDLTLSDGSTLRLYGQLDRLDTRDVDGRTQRLVIDYKTGSKEALKAKVSAPMEDTQLVFYALLSQADEGLEAAYLHLDAKGVSQIANVEVQAASQALLEGVMQDWTRLRAGHGLAAMGEGLSCAYCQVRGLCRKDHWHAQGAST